MKSKCAILHWQLHSLHKNVAPKSLIKEYSRVLTYYLGDLFSFMTQESVFKNEWERDLIITDITEYQVS